MPSYVNWLKASSVIRPGRIMATLLSHWESACSLAAVLPAVSLPAAVPVPPALPDEQADKPIAAARVRLIIDINFFFITYLLLYIKYFL